MFLGSGPLSLLGVATASWLESAYGDSVQSAEGYATGAALVLGAIGLILKTFVKRGVQPSEAGFVLQRKDKMRAIVLGIGLVAFVAWLLLQSRRREERADSARARAAGGDGDGLRGDAALEAR